GADRRRLRLRRLDVSTGRRTAAGVRPRARATGIDGIHPLFDDAMKTSRRAFLRNSTVAGAATAVSLPPAIAAAQNVVTEAAAADLKWAKAPCRFCGTGCGVMVGVKEGRVVATQADPQAEVNRGLNCVKGYYLNKILYGADRLTTPLLRMKDGRYDKNGEFAPVSWDKAFDVMAEQFKRVLREKGPTAVACSARASGRSGKATPRSSYTRRAFAATTSTRMRGIA